MIRRICKPTVCRVGFMLFLLVPVFLPCDLSAQEDERRERKKEKKEERSQLKDFKKESDSGEAEENESRDTRGGFFTQMMFNIGFDLLRSGLFTAERDSTGFQKYPYQEGTAFAMRYAPTYRSGFGQARIYYQYLNQDLYGIGFNFRVRINSRFGLSLDFTQFNEDLENRSMEKMLMVRLGLIKSLIINEQLIWDLDLGLRSFDAYGGGDVGLRFQVFPNPPFVFNFWCSAGAAEGHFLMELIPSAGVLIGRFQADLGYRFIRWGDKDLKGVVGGLKIWF